MRSKSKKCSAFRFCIRKGLQPFLLNSLLEFDKINGEQCLKIKTKSFKTEFFRDNRAILKYFKTTRRRALNFPSFEYQSLRVWRGVEFVSMQNRLKFMCCDWKTFRQF